MKTETEKRIETIKLMQRKLLGLSVGSLNQIALKALDVVTDTVMSYHPPAKTKKAKKRQRRRRKELNK